MLRALPMADVTSPPLPTTMQLEVTAACNLRCRMCLVRYRPKLGRTEGAMDFATFRALLDGNRRATDVILQGLGEPLLCPDIVRMVAYASSRGVRARFNSNATLLTARRAADLIDAGLHHLYVSLDGASAATYEHIRDGADFDRVRRNVLGLLQLRRERGVRTPRVTLVFVAMRHNINELPDLVRLAAEWQVDDVSVQNLSHSFDDAAGEPAYAEIRAFTAAQALWSGDAAVARRSFRRARDLARRLGVELALPRLDEETPKRPEGTPACAWPWESGYVLRDGRVQPCCMIMGADRDGAVLGDARRDSFAAVWHGQAFRDFRAALTTATPPDICRGCALYRGVF